MYEYAEDSQLIKDAVEGYIGDVSTVCEVGIGNGENIFHFAQHYPHKRFWGTDCDSQVIEYHAQNKIANLTLEHISYFPSSQIPFDLIFCNPPYLPNEGKSGDQALFGGKKGCEMMIELIHRCLQYIHAESVILLLYSSLSSPEFLLNTLKELRLSWKVVKQMSVAFEELYVIEIRPSLSLAAILPFEGRYLAKGKRSSVFVASTKKYVWKVGEISMINKEYLFLDHLKGRSWVPEVSEKREGALKMEYIDGVGFETFLKYATKSAIIHTIDQLLEIMSTLDTIGINKQEMNHPHKHIFIVEGGRVVLIDFERAVFSKRSKNKAQFVQYLYSVQLRFLLQDKGLSPLFKHVQEAQNMCQGTHVRFLELYGTTS